MSDYQWEGRDVRLVEFTVDEGEGSRLAFAEREYSVAIYHALQASAVYVDTGSRVFDSVETIRRLPNRHWKQLMDMGMEAARLNGILPEEAKPNGVDRGETVGPSL